MFRSTKIISLSSSLRRAYSSTSISYDKIIPSKEILSLIACPVSKTELIYYPKTHELISLEVGTAFPIHDDGTPILLPSLGRVLTPEELIEVKESF